MAVLAQSQELYDLGPEYDIYRLETLLEPDGAVSQLMEMSRILNSLSVRRDQLSHLRDGFAETSRPQLYFSVGAGLQNGDEKLGSSFGLDKPDVLVALDFRYPLGNRLMYRCMLQARHTRRQMRGILCRPRQIHCQDMLPKPRSTSRRHGRRASAACRQAAR